MPNECMTLQKSKHNSFSSGRGSSGTAGTSSRQAVPGRTLSPVTEGCCSQRGHVASAKSRQVGGERLINVQAGGAGEARHQRSECKMGTGVAVAFAGPHFGKESLGRHSGGGSGCALVGAQAAQQASGPRLVGWAAPRRDTQLCMAREAMGQRWGWGRVAWGRLQSQELGWVGISAAQRCAARSAGGSVGGPPPRTPSSESCRWA